eukprot:scaffold358_cov207-Alexandrium_tamarense.AAC.41
METCHLNVISIVLKNQSTTAGSFDSIDPTSKHMLVPPNMALKNVSVVVISDKENVIQVDSLNVVDDKIVAKNTLLYSEQESDIVCTRSITTWSDDGINDEDCYDHWVFASDSKLLEHQEASGPSAIKLKVNFGSVTVRAYDIILGDNPSCSYGPPIAIDGLHFVENSPIDVNEYEYNHASKRSIKDMRLNYYQRMNILTNAGYTKKEINKVQKKANRANLRRRIMRKLSVFDFVGAMLASKSRSWERRTISD